MPVLLLNDFSGGINSRFRANRIADNQSPTLRNVRVLRRGSLTKKFGSNLIGINSGSTTLEAILLYSYFLTGMSDEQMLAIVRDTSGNLYRTTDGITFTNPANLGFDLTSRTTACHAIIFGDLVYIYEIGMDTRSWDNTSIVTIATSTTNFPRARFAEVFKSRVFCGYIHDGAATRRSRLKWSNYGDSSNGAWGATNFEDISINDGGVIRGLKAFGDELIIFKGPENSTTAVSHANARMIRFQGDTFDANNPEYSIDDIPLRPGVGLLHNDTIQLYEGKMIFLTNDGWYEYVGGGIMPSKISEIIQPDIDDFSFLSFRFDSQFASFVFDNRYYCSARSAAHAQSYTQRIYVLEKDKWFLDLISSTADDYTIGDGAPVSYVKFLGNLYGASPTTSTIGGISTGTMRRIEVEDQFTENTQNDSAANVNFSYTTKEFDFGDETQFDVCFIHLRRQAAGTLTLEVNVDQRGVTSTSLDMTAPDTGTTENSSSNLLRKQVLIGRRGRTIQFRFYNSGNNDIEIYAIELLYAKVPSTRMALI